MTYGPYDLARLEERCHSDWKGRLYRQPNQRLWRHQNFLHFTRWNFPDWFINDPAVACFFCQKSWDSRAGWKSGQHPDIWYFWLAWKLVSAIGFSERYFSTSIFPHASIFSLFPVVAKILAFQGWTKDYLRPAGGSSDEAETNYVNCFSKTSLFRPKIIASQTSHLSTK